MTRHLLLIKPLKNFRVIYGFLVLQILVLQTVLLAQSPSSFHGDSASLEQCLDYALSHQPLIRQLKLNEEITKKDIGIALSDWLPHINANAGYQRYIKLPVSIFPDFTNPEGPKREITTGVINTSTIQFSADQVIFNSDVYLAGKSAGLYRLNSIQATRQSKIELVVKLSKAFYDVLLSEEKLNFLQEDLQRMDRSLKDALSQYEAGVSDKIDYQRAQISLNNVKAEIMGTREEIKAKYAYLKELMGYPVNGSFSVAYDSLTIIRDAIIDTTNSIEYANRIDYQILMTSLRLQKSTIGYYKMDFLPSLSAYANYNLVFQNDNVSDLYNREFPNSSVGLRLSFPLFDGTRRIQQIKRANLKYREMALDTLNLKNRINTEYEQGMASYKSNLKAFQAAQVNSRIANEVYNTVKLQYNQGIKTYLEVIVSESDLRTSRINELDALFRLLSSKIDVENARGDIAVK